jgi:ATP-binding cassette subfamily F protein 3
MLLRPSNTLLMDEPTNHLDLDSKDVLLEALEDYGGTLIIVSHDRYFVEKLATKIIEIGHGQALVYPGTYTEFLWHKEQALGPGRSALGARGQRPKAESPEQALGAGRSALGAQGQGSKTQGPKGPGSRAESPAGAPKAPSRDERKRVEAERRKQQRATEALQARIAALEARIAEREAQVKELETTMSAPGFYDNRETSRTVIDRHQALMWEVGDLMSQWEALQEHASEQEGSASAQRAES